MKITQYESQLAAYNAQYSGGGGSVGADVFAGAASDSPEALARFGGAAAGVGEQALEAYATAQQQRTPVDLVQEGNALEADYADFYADYIANNTGEQAKNAAAYSASFLHQRLNAWYERWQGNPYAQQYIAQHGGRLSARAHAVAEQFAQQEQQAYTQQVFNSKLALAESALGDASLTEEDFAAIRTDLGNTAKALFPDQDTGTLHTTIERRVIGTRLKANLAQNRFEAARQALAGQEALLGEQMPVYAGAIRRAEALALAQQEKALQLANQATQQAAVERAYQSLYGQGIEQAEALLDSEENRVRFGLDAQGAEQTLGLLRAYASHTQAEQAKTRQQEEYQLLNTVLNLAQGTPGQTADPVAACKAVQAFGLDPQTKQQVMLALEQGRINTNDDPQSLNALAEDIIRGQSRDTEMALTRAMAAGQLTHKSRERLTQLQAQLDGPYGPMLQHAYAGLAAHFGQDGSAAAQQQLAQQHLQAGFNQALTSNNFPELERLSHPDVVAAIAARYRQPAQTQTDYLEHFNPLEGPHLSAAQGGSRSDAGNGTAQSHEQLYDGMATMDYGWAAALADTDSAKILLDGMQHSVPALAARGKEADMLPPERRGTFSATEHFIHSLGQIIGDMPVYAVGGAAGSAGGPAGAAALSFATTEALRAYYLDAIRKGEIKSIDDVLRRLQASVQGAAHGATQGLGMATGAGLGARLAAGAGPTTAMLSQTLGELFGLNGASALIQGHFPSQEEFQHNATLLLGLKSAHRASKSTQETVTVRLKELWEKVAIKPEDVFRAAQKDYSVLEYLETQKGEVPEALVAEIEKAVIYNDNRSLKMAFRETGVEPSLSDRPQLRKYLESLKPEEILALKLKDQDAYMAMLKSIVQEVFPEGEALRFRKEGDVQGYEHFIKDSGRRKYIHSLPRTLKDSDITIEFTTAEGNNKAYYIKKYFNQEIQKDIWDILVFHDVELVTKLAREDGKGRGSIESMIIQEADSAKKQGAINEASRAAHPWGDTENASTPRRNTEKE